MSLFIPSDRTAVHIVEEFAEQGLCIEDLVSQVMTRVEIADALVGKRPLSPRRIYRVVLDVVAARRRNGLRPYPAEVIQSFIWLFADN